MIIKTSCYALLLQIVLFSNILFAQNPFATPLKERLWQGIELTIVNDFSAAAAHFDSLIADYPDQPFGYFYLAATLQAEMLDRERYDNVEKFKELMDRSIDLGGERRDELGDQPWLLFIEGSSHLYKSFMDSKLSRIWGAYRNAVKGVDLLEKALKIDSSFYDAFLGVGSYKYWKSSKAKSLTWLPFLSDEREKGIAMVQTAIDSGRFVPLVGRDQLAWIMLDAGRTAEAYQLARKNLAQYPESRFFLWTMVEVCFRDQRYSEARELYEKLLLEVRQIPGNNHYNETTCLLRLAELKMHDREFAEARTLLETLLALPLESAVAKRAEKKHKKAREMLRECEKAISQMEHPLPTN